MNKYTYILITLYENGKYYSFVEKWHNGSNLVCLFERYPSAHTMNICDSKKQADETAEHWNENWKNKGIYLY